VRPLDGVEDEDPLVGGGPRLRADSAPLVALVRGLDQAPAQIGIAQAARLLVERRLSYEDALARYFPRLLEAYGGDRSRIFSFDGIHEQYI